ncbi:MAG TPA: hypothetical protein VFN03_12710 [Trueperaceae bacterium]|nr:hypothetical protein [Trueperaceae bacterium]
MSLGHRWSVPLVLLAVLIGCTPPPTPVPTRVEINPTGVLLTAGSPTRQLTAVVFDQFDRPLDTPVTWASSDAASISVGTDGLVQAHGATGSSVVTASVGGAKGNVLAVAAQPVEGATVVADDNIVGEPRALGGGLEFGVGYQYEVTVVGIAPPAVGSILLSDGAKAVAGRVVAVSADIVTLEMVPIDEVFAQLDIDASIDLSTAPFVTPSGVESVFVSERMADGRVRLTQRPGTTLTSPAALAPQAEFGAGPFSCETELNAVQVNLAQATMTFEPDLSYDIVWNDTQQKLVLHGSPKVTLDVSPVLSATIDGKVTCEFTFREIQVPVPGPLGILLAAVVPIGAGFEIGGKLPIANVGVQFKGDVGAAVQLGFDCNPACVPIQSLTTAVSGNATPLLPAALAGPKLEASAYAFLFAKLEGGARFSSILRVEAIEAEAGIKLEAKLASEETQALDDAYASEYEALFEASIAAGSDFDRFLDLIRVTVAKLELKVTHSIAKSPRGTVAADRPDFSVGDTVNFLVTLDASTLTFPVVGHNVASVRVYRQTGSSLVLANQTPVAAGQSVVNIPWVATVDGTVVGNFVAFVETNLLAAPRLELGAVSAAGPEAATLTYSQTIEGEREEVFDSTTINEEGQSILSATFQLRLLSETPTQKLFEIVSGTVQLEGSEDYVEVTLNGGSGDCTFDERIEDHSTSEGTVQASGGVQLDLFGGDAYSINVTDQAFEVAITGVWTVEYTFHGPETGCRSDENDPYEDSFEEELAIEVSGTSDSGTPGTLTGTIVEELSDGFTGTKTTTWLLQIQ